MWEGKVKIGAMKKEDMICYRCIYSDPGDMTIEEAMDERTAYPIPCLRYAALVCTNAKTDPYRKCAEGEWRSKLSSNRTDIAWKTYYFASQDLLE